MLRIIEMTMNLNSNLFDRIRVKRAPEAEQTASGPPCNHPGCKELGLYRAPMGRLREGQFFCFCLDHVREYNASYNYFNGMTDEAVAKYQKDATIGHRPTWTMGANRGARTERYTFTDTIGPYARPGFTARREPRYGPLVMKALDELGLDDTADAGKIKARYKELVKKWHPDANGGDRSCEDKLREIIRAYNYLRSAKVA
jgi:hypothetical protein